jgi:hypothetical protein
MAARRATILALVVATAIGTGVGAAGAADAAGGGRHPRIGPNQEFVGLVNGSTGQKSPAEIRVACPGPSRGQTAHPLPHQSLAVRLPAATTGTVGRTGPAARRISAFLVIPPSAAATGGLATFRHYGRRKAIPTSITVPCSGSGYVTFVPFPRAPGESVPFVVPVE